MPTEVNPMDPNATGAGRLQAMVGGREPGTPSVAGKPTPQAGRYSFPAPPAPATAPVGRPPSPAPAPGLTHESSGARGTMASQPGTVPAPGVGSPAAAPPSAAPSPATPGSSQPAPGAGSSVTAGTGAPAAPAPPTVDQNGAATQTFTSPTIPQPGSVMPGAAVQTPYGTVSVGPDGRQSLALDAAGQQKYKEGLANLRAKFSVPRVMKGMTGLPTMDLKLGASNFDPFSGRFHGKE